MSESESDTGVPPVPSQKTAGTAVSLFHPLDKTAEITRTQRNLPHWTQPGCTYFVTFRLADSLSQSKLAELRANKETWLKFHPKPWTRQVQSEYERRFIVRVQRWLDAGYGSCALRSGDLRSVVTGALHHFDGARYGLDSYVVMPNHVHVLVRPACNSPAGTAGSLSTILHSWKSFSAHEIGKVLNRDGPFWMDENFDHAVRSEAQLAYFRDYIRENPAKAGLREGAYSAWERDTGVPPVPEAGE